MKKIQLVLMFAVAASASSLATASLVPPPVIAGVITADGVPLGGTTVHVQNLDTGEHQEQETAYDGPHTTCGGYAVAIAADDGHMVEVSVKYESELYWDILTVDLQSSINWLNLSISTGEPSPPPPDDDDVQGDDDDSQDEPPVGDDDDDEAGPGNDTEEQTEPMYSLTITVTDNSTAMPVDNATVIIYDTGANMITDNLTNETGHVVFQLEEGEYIIEASGGDYAVGRDRITLSSSMNYALSLKEEGTGGNNLPYTPPQNVQQGFPLVYLLAIAGIGIAGLVLACLFILIRKVNRERRHKV